MGGGGWWENLLEKQPSGPQENIPAASLGGGALGVHPMALQDCSRMLSLDSPVPLNTYSWWKSSREGHVDV